MELSDGKSGAYAMSKADGNDGTLGPGPNVMADLGPRRRVALQHRTLILNTLQRRRGPFQWNELQEAGVNYYALREMVSEGTVIHPVQGIFALQADYDPMMFAFSTLAVRGTDFAVCLNSAAYIHGLLGEMDEYLTVMLPLHRRLIGEVMGMKPVPVQWKHMSFPVSPRKLSDAERAAIGLKAGMSPDDAADRYFGIEKIEGCGVRFKITSPARTVCDLLMALERNLRRVESDRSEMATAVAFDVLMAYALRYDLTDAQTMATRLGYDRSVIHHIQFAERFLSRPLPKPSTA